LFAAISLHPEGVEQGIRDNRALNPAVIKADQGQANTSERYTYVDRYIAVLFDGVLHYLPSLGTSPAPFRTNPSETFFEKVLSVPITGIPYKQYTFYAALLDSSFQFVSNLDTAGPISAGVK